MALAAFTLYKRTGTSPGSEDDSSWNPCFLSSDLHSTSHGSYTIPAPESGYVYSYENWLRLKCTSAPDNTIANIKWWFAGSGPGTGLDIMVGTTAAYATPVDSASSVATTDANTHSDVSSALSWGTPQASDEITAVGQYTDYLVAQLRVGATASQSAMTDATIHYQYDES